MKHWIKILSLFLLMSLAGQAQAATYTIDTAHSAVLFKVRHLIGSVNGSFKKFSGSFDYDPKKPESWKAEATIEASSIDTGNEKRDNHLRTKDFFDVDNAEHPEFKTIKFVSTKVSDATGNKAKLHGNLTIRGITKPVVLDMAIGGVATDPWGNTMAGMSATTTINRKDFGLTWNQALETGGVLVGEEVAITLEIEGQLKKEEKPITKEKK